MKIFLRFAALAALALIMGVTCFGQRCTQTNLVSNASGIAPITDPQLIDPWGVFRGSASRWWISDKATGFSTLQDASGKPLAINGVRALNPGNVSPNNNDAAAEPAAEAYFTAGPNHGSGGLHGYLTAVATKLTEGNDQ